MKRLSTLVACVFAVMLLAAADGCSSDPNVEGAKLDLRNQDYDRALENVNTALENDPNNAEALELKGRILMAQADGVTDPAQHAQVIRDMVAAFNRAAEVDPGLAATVQLNLQLLREDLDDLAPATTPAFAPPGLRSDGNAPAAPFTMPSGYVGRGWYGIIKELVEDLIKLGWNREVVQIKEKFGTLRFHTTHREDALRDRIIAAREHSAEVCEVCGKGGSLRTSPLHAFMTRCDPCWSLEQQRIEDHS